MQTAKERAAVQAFYYGKIAEGLSREKAGNLIQAKDTCNEFGGGWVDVGIKHQELNFHSSINYRIKPETVTHPGGEYPKPCDDAEAILAQGCYFPEWRLTDGVLSFNHAKVSFVTLSSAQSYAKSGMCYLTAQEAEERAKVMLGLK